MLGEPYEGFRLLQLLEVRDPDDAWRIVRLTHLIRRRMKIRDDRIGAAPVVLRERPGLAFGLHDDAMGPPDAIGQRR